MNCLIYFIIQCFVLIEIGRSESNKPDSNVVHYNIPDPDCTGPFGSCTQEDKDRLGYAAIKKLHENMDDDRDGQVEIQETKEFMTEELQYKNEIYEREQKFHGSDSLISVEEMWKSWKHSKVYNWSTEDVITWLNEQVKLPQYADYFRRNRIDGQFMPRFAINENNFYSNVMQIRDSRHRRLLIIKSTDLVLFGPPEKPHNLIKDVMMITSLTLSILVCIYLYNKHRQSLDQVKKLMVEFDKLSTSEGDLRVNQIKNNLRIGDNQSKSSIFGSLQRKSTVSDLSNETYLSVYQSSADVKDYNLLNEKNTCLLKELNIAKQEAEILRKERENADGQLYQLELAEKELEKVRAALKQTEARLELVKYQPPSNLVTLLNRTYEYEKELIDYKYKIIEKEKEACYEALNKISKRQSGIFGALKIAHSSNLEEINNKIEKLKRELAKFKSEKQEWSKRWSGIDEICQRNDMHHQSSISETSSHELR